MKFRVPLSFTGLFIHLPVDLFLYFDFHHPIILIINMHFIVRILFNYQYRPLLIISKCYLKRNQPSTPKETEKSKTPSIITHMRARASSKIPYTDPLSLLSSLLQLRKTANKKNSALARARTQARRERTTRGAGIKTGFGPERASQRARERDRERGGSLPSALARA